AQAHLSAEAHPPQARARVPGPDGDQERPLGAGPPPPEGPPGADGLRREEVHPDQVQPGPAVALV
ncbi:MAG: LSU ribosomal protein L34p, partial [uncultured Thermomicrobiales bacterium]